MLSYREQFLRKRIPQAELNFQEIRNQLNKSRKDFAEASADARKIVNSIENMERAFNSLVKLVLLMLDHLEKKACLDFDEGKFKYFHFNNY